MNTNVLTRSGSAYSKKQGLDNDGYGPLELPLERASQSYDFIMKIAKKEELFPSVSQLVHYKSSEIEKSEYFQMNLHAPYQNEGVNNETFGTQYEGGCPNPKCRLGKKLVGEVLADRKLLKNRDIGLLAPGIFVSEKLKTLFCEADLTGADFEHEVKDYKQREMARTYVLNITSVLPPMADSTWLVTEDRNTFIDKCGHYNPYLRSDIQYEREKLKEAKDFNLSFEHLYGLRQYREIIVSAKVRSLFKKHKIRAGFFPVAIL